MSPEGLRAGAGEGFGEGQQGVWGAVRLPSGMGKAPGKYGFGCIWGLQKSSNFDISQSVGRFQLSGLCKKIYFTIVGSPQTPLAPAKRRPCPATHDVGMEIDTLIASVRHVLLSIFV